MDVAVAPPPRRQAALKATAHLVDLSSSDQESDDQDGRGNYAVNRRVKRNLTKRKKEDRGHNKKGGSARVAEDGAAAGGLGSRKRKGDDLAFAGSPRKRRRGVESQKNRPALGDSGIEESDLTSLSSSSEEEESKRSQPHISHFPFPLHSPTMTGSSRSRQHRREDDKKPGSLPGISDLDDDSDDLPDIGTVISQGTLGPKIAKSRKIDKHKTDSTPARHKFDGQIIQAVHDTPISLLSSSPPPPSSLPFSSHGTSTDEGNTTEAVLSDYLHLPDIGDDSDFDDMDDAQTYKDELCLAKTKSTEAVFWPAKILALKKTDGKGRGKHKVLFQVMFLDKTQKEIPREWFYTSWQDEFSTCKIGKFESSHVEVVNDIDEESTQTQPTPIAASNTNTRPLRTPSRSPSPINLPSSPPSGPAYCDLPLRHQFIYAQPVLKAIMDARFVWGLRRHESFVKGGTARSRLAKEGGMKGSIDARAVDELLVLVERWCLGGKGREGFVDDDESEEYGRGPQDQNNREGNDLAGSDQGNALAGGDIVEVPTKMPQNVSSVPMPAEAELGTQVEERRATLAQEAESLRGDDTTGRDEAVLSQPSQPQPQPPPLKHKRLRQRGSPAYESLSPLDKVQYCIEVLLPEAIIQILLWRVGERKSPEVMWDNTEEEERLYRRGEELLKETDWVMDVMRLRRRLEEKERAKGEKGADGGGQRRGAELRKTRSGRFGGAVGSYRE